MSSSYYLNSVRTSLQSAGGYSSRALGGFGSLKRTAESGQDSLRSVGGAANEASHDTVETDSAGAGAYAANALSSAGGIADSGASSVYDLNNQVRDVQSALDQAQSALRSVGSEGGDISAAQREIERAISYQGTAGNAAGYVQDALRNADSAISRANDDARYIMADEPERDVSNYGHSLGGNAGNAANSFSEAGSQASSGESSQQSVSSSISSALSAVDTLERQLQAMNEQRESEQAAAKEAEQRQHEAARVTAAPVAVTYEPAPVIAQPQSTTVGQNSAYTPQAPFSTGNSFGSWQPAPATYTPSLEMQAFALQHRIDQQMATMKSWPRTTPS